MRRFARGTTLTPEERRMLGLESPSTWHVPLVRLTRPRPCLFRHSAERFSLPGGVCPLRPPRPPLRLRSSVCQQVWITGLWRTAFPRLNRKPRSWPPRCSVKPSRRSRSGCAARPCLPGQANAHREKPHMSAQTAARCAGCYCVCLRFESGFFMPLGRLYEDPDKAVRELAEGVHKEVRLVRTAAGGRHLQSLPSAGRSRSSWAANDDRIVDSSPEEPPPSQDMPDAPETDISS